TSASSSRPSPRAPPLRPTPSIPPCPRWNTPWRRTKQPDGGRARPARADSATLAEHVRGARPSFLRALVAQGHAPGQPVLLAGAPVRVLRASLAGAAPATWGLPRRHRPIVAARLALGAQVRVGARGRADVRRPDRAAALVVAAAPRDRGRAAPADGHRAPGGGPRRPAGAGVPRQLGQRDA